MLPRLKQFAADAFPIDTHRGRWARSFADRARRARRGLRRGRESNDVSLDDVLREAEDRKGIVIYPPYIDWTWMRQRPQQLMLQFARAGYLSLFCSPQKRTDSFDGFRRVADRLYLCDSVDALYDLPDPIILTNWTDHVETLRRFRRPTVIYDYLDSLGAAFKSGAPNRQKLERHRKLVDESEIVLATARRLYDEVRARRHDAIYCPNGVDYAHFHLSAPPPVPADIADLAATGRPIVGYYGALARWFDYELTAHAARVRRDYEFLLIGPDFDGTLASSRLARLPNVRRLREKRYEELPSYLYYFSAAVIPFLIDDVTEAVSPVKLFEYMAGGKPIVATDMPECRRYPCVLVAGDREDYAAKIDEAIGRGKQESFRRSLDEEAAKNTWETRIGQIIARIKDFEGRSMADGIVAVRS